MLWSKGDGSDTITSTSSVTTEIDVLQLLDVNSDEVEFSKVGTGISDDLKIKIKSTGEIIIVQDFFYGGISLGNTDFDNFSYGVEKIIFADGANYDREKIASLAWYRGNDDANVVGGKSDRPETLIGYKGNDVLNGDEGVASTYIWSKGDGSDKIVESILSKGGDKLILSDVSLDDVKFSYVGSTTLAITILSTGEVIQVLDQFSSSFDVATNATNTLGLETIEFSNGVTLDHAGIYNKLGQDFLGLKWEYYQLSYNGFIVAEYYYDDFGHIRDVSRYGSGDSYPDLIDRGSGGHDYLQGTNQTSNSNGQDLLVGNRGSDVILGRSGDDVLYGDGDNLLIDEVTFIDDGMDAISGENGNDIIHGGGGNDIIDGGSGDDTLIGGTGNDDIFGDAGADAVTGSAGDDLLDGATGSDVYYFRKNDGHDVVNDSGSSATDIDRVVFSGISSSEVTLGRVAGTNAILATINSTGDTFRFESSYAFGTGTIYYGIEQIEFSDVVWNRADFIPRAMTLGTNEREALKGTSLNDTFNAGKGDDILFGAAGTDRFIYSKGDGNDVINEFDSSDNFSATQLSSNDALVFTDVKSNEVELSRIPGTNHVAVNILATGEQITLLESYASNSAKGVDKIEFSDGVTWDRTTLLSKISLAGTDSIDSLLGSATADDNFFGLEGPDLLKGLGGNDRYIYYKGHGDDVIDDAANSDSDTLVLADLLPGDVVLGVFETATGNWNIGDDIRVRVNATGETIALVSSALSDGTSGVDRIQFQDGTLWTRAQVLYQATAGSGYYSGTIGDDNAIGSALNQRMEGRQGDDFIDGKGGSDIVFGQQGNDTLAISVSNPGDIDALDGGVAFALTSAFDTVTFANFGSAVSVDFIVNNGQALTSDASTLAGGPLRLIATLTELENIVGTAFSDYLAGNGYANVITGGAGDDVLEGRTGKDELAGGLGIDTLNGGADGDKYVWSIGDGNDTVVEILGEGLTPTSADEDTLVLHGVLPANASLVSSGTSLFINLNGTEKIKISDQFGSASLSSGIEKIIFDNGTVWDKAYINANVIGNVAPVANADGPFAIQGSATLTLTATQIIGNDTDVNGDPLKIVGISSTTNGTAALLANGDVTFEANPGYVGSAQFTYIVSDGSDRNSGTVSFNVTRNAISGTSTANTLTGSLYDDSIDGLDGNDTLIGGGGADVLIGGIGIDTASYANSASGVTVDLSLGTAAQDSLGDARRDSLSGIENIIGSTLDDKLSGDVLANRLEGLAGDDIYVVGLGDTTVEVAGGGTDVVQSTVTWTLEANVENLILSGINAVTGIGNALANTLDGSGNTAANRLEGLAGDDTYIVGNGDTTIELASGGNDTVKTAVAWTLAAETENLILTGNAAVFGKGNTAANVLDGLQNSAANQLEGLAGNDTYIVGEMDTIIELANGGIDTVQTSFNRTLSTEVENLIFTGNAAVIGIGNALANTMDGAGNVTGNRLEGLAGNDTYVVGAGDTTIELVGGGIDTVQASISWTLASEVENLTLLGAANVSGVGNSLANTITGNSGANLILGGSGIDILNGGAGNDTLDGEAGNDTLDGGDGNDTLNANSGTDILIGGLGNDTYVVSSASNTITETSVTNSGVDTVKSFATISLGANLENLVLLGQSAISGTGNGLANSITGNGADNVIDGGLLNDAMAGGLGNHTYKVDDVGDTIVENLNEGIDTVEANITVAASTYTLSSNVENLTLLGTTAINGTGNSLDNTLNGSGNSAGNVLRGGLGDDIYVVGTNDTVFENLSEGTDTVRSAINWTLGSNFENLTLTNTGTTVITGTGNALANLILSGAGSNTLSGGAATGDANDTVSYSSATTAVSVSLAVTTAQTTGGGGSDTLTNFENLIGSNFDDSLTGSTAVNVLTGLGGDDNYLVQTVGDTVVEAAGGGVDTVNAVNVAFTLSAEVEKLILTGTAAVAGTGNSLANTLSGSGNTGANVLTGGAGDDIYIVGAGDSTIESLNEGIDTVQSAITWTLATSGNVENLTLTAATAINGTGNDLNNVLLGGAGTNVLSAGIGNDILNGDLGNDTLTGGTGADTFVFSTALNATTNMDTIGDFVVVDDTILIAKSIFTAFTVNGALATDAFKNTAAGAIDATDRIIYNSTTGAVTYDTDGSGAAVAVQFAKLTAGLAITELDFAII